MVYQTLEDCLRFSGSMDSQVLRLAGKSRFKVPQGLHVFDFLMYYRFHDPAYCRCLDGFTQFTIEGYGLFADSGQYILSLNSIFCHGVNDTTGNHGCQIVLASIRQPL